MLIFTTVFQSGKEEKKKRHETTKKNRKTRSLRSNKIILPMSLKSYKKIPEKYHLSCLPGSFDKKHLVYFKCSSFQCTLLFHTVGQIKGFFFHVYD